MKVLFIFPPNPYPKSPLAFGFPLGLGYLASILEQDGHIVSLYDACFENNTMEEIENHIIAFNPDIVAITVYTALAKSAVKICELCKKLSKGIIVCAGGSHATYDAENLLNHGFDYVFKGDSEISFSDFIQSDQPQRIIDSIPINNLDDLPFPAYHIVNFQKYIKPYLLPNAISIMSSRGCSHRCAFCSQSHFKGQWQARSPENVIAEIDFLTKTYTDIQSIQFYDDNFTFDKERVFKLCDLLIGNHFNKYGWCCLARVDQVDEKMLRAMKDAGCVKVSYGVESGSDKILKNIHKGLNKEKCREAFKMTTKLGMEALAFFMVGNPGETDETINESIKFARSLASTSTLWAITQVYPGTELATKQPSYDYIEYLYMPELYNIYPFTHPCVPVFEQAGLGREALKEWQTRLLKIFLIHHSFHNFKTYLKHFLSSPKNALNYVRMLFHG